VNRPVAVVGVGQTTFRTSRPEVSAPELVFEAASNAYGHANADPTDVDAVVFASAPEVFEGVHEPDRWCTEAIGGVGKPVLRIHTGGATGGSAAIAGAELVSSGRFDSVLVVAVQRVAESPSAQQIFTTIFDAIYEADVQLNVIAAVALIASRQLAHGLINEHHMDLVAKKNHEASAKNPVSHLHRPVSLDEIATSRMIATPLRLFHCCPRSDGACAVLIMSPERAARFRRAAWIRGRGTAADVYRLGDRIDDMGYQLYDTRALEWATKAAYKEAGITDPRNQIDVIELYAPFSNLEITNYESLGIAPRGQGARLVEEGATSLGGDIPVNPSGGPMTSNPIGATGLVRVAEAALQVMHDAGEHQVEGAFTAVATASGGIDQFATVTVLDRGND
jgi:acetyl-CoA C-acetyltransferase